MSQVFPVIIPQIIVNDDSVIMKNWLVEDGASVKAGDAICEVETSKALTEISAEQEFAYVRSDVRKSLTLAAIFSIALVALSFVIK